MPTIELHHCEPVVIFGSDADSNVIGTVTVGGAAGDGEVEISTVPPPPMPIPPLPTGGIGPINALGVTQITLHYRKAPGGPSSIYVTYSYTVT